MHGGRIRRIRPAGDGPLDSEDGGSDTTRVEMNSLLHVVPPAVRLADVHYVENAGEPRTRLGRAARSGTERLGETDRIREHTYLMSAE
mgnify:CR=1 FL=1